MSRRILPGVRLLILTETEYIERVLRRTGWNFVEAAKVLDIQRTYLHQKVTALGIERQT